MLVLSCVLIAAAVRTCVVVTKHSYSATCSNALLTAAHALVTAAASSTQYSALTYLPTMRVVIVLHCSFCIR
jgi:hypothetical protein